MIARSFKSVAWVAAIGVAALMCYMVSLRGAAERAELTELNLEMVRLERSIRTLQTELGTRGRVHQLQHWASSDFGFAAPVANQFMEDEVTLARFDRAAEPAPMDAPVRMAQAPVQAPVQAQRAAPQDPPASEPAPTAAPQMPRIVRASAPRPSAAAPAQPMLRRAAASAPAARTAVRPAVAPARPEPTRAAAATTTRAAARPAPLVSARTLRDLSTRARTEGGATGRSRTGAN